MKPWLLALIVGVLLVGIGCGGHLKIAPPPSLTGPGVSAYYANEAAIVIGGIQHTAIGLNGIKLCAEAQPPAPPMCRPLLSDDDTRATIDIVADTVIALEKVPAGWLPTIQTALDRIAKRLSEYGKTKLLPYIYAARSIINNWVTP